MVVSAQLTTLRHIQAPLAARCHSCSCIPHLCCLLFTGISCRWSAAEEQAAWITSMSAMLMFTDWPVLRGGVNGVAILLLALSVHALSQGDSGPNDVELQPILARFQRPHLEDDLQRIYTDTIEQDMQIWMQRNPQLSVEDLQLFVGEMATGRTKRSAHYSSLWIIKDGMVRWTFLNGKGPANGFFYRGPCMEGVLFDAMRVDGLKLPDTMFIWNALDYPVCPPGSCPVPIFSSYKLWSEHQHDEDILVPQVNHKFKDLYNYPWGLKDPRAVFRGGGHCSELDGGECTRYTVWQQAKKYPELLDVGFTHPKVEELLVNGTYRELAYLKPEQLVKVINPLKYAKYKYLINMDGYTGSARLWRLLSCNSVTLKAKSMWVDSHSRALRDGEHLLTWQDDKGDTSSLLRMIRMLHRRDKLAQRIAKNGQDFVSKYKNLHHLRRFYVEALTRYTALFGGHMERYVASLNVSHLRPGFSNDLMPLVQGFVQKYGDKVQAGWTGWNTDLEEEHRQQQGAAAAAAQPGGPDSRMRGRAMRGVVEGDPAQTEGLASGSRGVAGEFQPGRKLASDRLIDLAAWRDVRVDDDP